MKVLWFTNTPGSGEEFLKTKVVGGGWLKSLDKEISKDVELAVAFYYSKPAVNFKDNNINFFPITQINWKWQTIKGMIFPLFIDEEDLQKYISIVEDFKPDIIHVWGTELSFGLLNEITDIPAIMSERMITYDNEDKEIKYEDEYQDSSIKYDSSFYHYIAYFLITLIIIVCVFLIYSSTDGSNIDLFIIVLALIVGGYHVYSHYFH